MLEIICDKHDRVNKFEALKLYYELREMKVSRNLGKEKIKKN